ncbi:glycosyltransferase [Amaricoccus sp.]|uniref:glycosyltransferase n=1 Tax=Amaricoccus sp. TaxID=1872485 RepID=UPI00262193F3|nr:glycosyltransferase [Amaricoccus sp.]HRO10857.1 glycosyltransferase [Amaricoccus sp.]
MLSNPQKRRILQLLRMTRFQLARVFFFFSSSNDKSTIIFGEKDGLEARDNSYILFADLYDAGRRDVYFVAASRCRDREKLERFGKNVLRYGTFRHFAHLARARLLVVSDGYLDVYPPLPGILKKADIPFFYLQHGVLRYKRVNFTASHYEGRLLRFVVSTDFEADIATDRMVSTTDVNECRRLALMGALLGLTTDTQSRSGLGELAHALRAYAGESADPVVAAAAEASAKKADQISRRAGLPAARLVESGLPRHDRLKFPKPGRRENIVPIFLTWRNSWARGSATESSPFVHMLRSLLEDPSVLSLSREYGVRYKVYVHNKQKSYARELHKLLPGIVDVDLFGDIGDEIGACLALITDYSSVAIDFVLGSTPVIFYQPDMLEYTEERGDYTGAEGDWVGPVATEPSGVAEALRNAISHGLDPQIRSNLLESYPNFGRSLPTLRGELDSIPPRVLFVAYNIFGTGGTVRAVTNFANYLLERGYHIEIISLRRTKVIPDMGLDPAIRVYSLLDHTQRLTWWEKFLGRSPSVLVHRDSDFYRAVGLLMDIRLVSRIRSSTADVIIPTFPGLAPICNRFRRGRSAVLVQENKFFDSHKASIQKMIRRSYARAAAVTVLSDSDARVQASFCKKVFNVGNGLPDPVRDEAYRDPSGRPRIVALGRFEDWKRFDLLISAFSRLTEKFPQWELHIFGRGEEEPKLRAMIKEGGLSERIFLRGVTTDSMGELSRGEICAMPSEYEPFGMVLIEAYAASRPVVTFDVETGPKEIVIDGETGFRAVPGDVGDFAAKLALLMASPSMRAAFGRKAREVYEERYSIEAAGRRLEEAIYFAAGRQFPSADAAAQGLRNGSGATACEEKDVSSTSAPADSVRRALRS